MKLGKETAEVRAHTDAKARRELNAAISEDRDYILLVRTGASEIEMIAVTSSHEATAIMMRSAARHIATPKLVGIARPDGEKLQ